MDRLVTSSLKLLSFVLVCFGEVWKCEKVCNYFTFANVSWWISFEWIEICVSFRFGVFGEVWQCVRKYVVVIFLRINARLDFLRGMMRWLEIFISLFSYV